MADFSTRSNVFSDLVQHDTKAQHKSYVHGKLSKY